MITITQTNLSIDNFLFWVTLNKVIFFYKYEKMRPGWPHFLFAQSDNVANSCLKVRFSGRPHIS